MLGFRPKTNAWAKILERNMRFYEKHKHLPRDIRLQLAVEQGLITPQTLEKLNAVERRIRLAVNNET